MSMGRRWKKRAHDRRRGSSLVVVSLMMVGLAVLSVSLFTVVNSGEKAQKSTREQSNAKYVAEAGLSVALMDLSRGADPQDVSVGSVNQPVAFGNSSYWVTATDLGGNLYEMTATGVENNVGSQLKVVLREVTDSQHVWAAFGDEGLTMDSNAKADSYNSSLGLYTDQDVNGSGSSSYALSNGNIGSNANVGADSNVKVWGNATPGPSGTASITGNAVVSGSTQPATALVSMPAITLPSLVSMGDHAFDGSGSGAFHDYIPAGDHRFDSVEVDMNQLTIVGPATLVFANLSIESNSEVIVDATNGPVEIFIEGDFLMNSNTLLASSTWTPADIELNLLSNNIVDPSVNVDLDEVDFNSNAELYGVVYAPNALVEINSNFELFGSLVAKQVHLDSNSFVHFDEALLSSNSSSERQLETVAWRHVPYHP